MQECGAAFTTKLEKMFQDCDVSGNLLQQYELHHESTIHLTTLLRRLLVRFDLLLQAKTNRLSVSI
jgi:hypothetical protein